MFGNVPPGLAGYKLWNVGENKAGRAFLSTVVNTVRGTILKGTEIDGTSRLSFLNMTEIFLLTSKTQCGTRAGFIFNVFFILK